MLWEIDVHPSTDQPDRDAQRLIESASATGFTVPAAATARGYLLESAALSREDVQRIATALVVDGVVERGVAAAVGDPALAAAPPSRFADDGSVRLITVLLKPGVMDPVSQSAEQAIAELGYPGVAVHTLRKVWVDGLDRDRAVRLAQTQLANDAIERFQLEPLSADHFTASSGYDFKLLRVELAGLDDAGLMRLSREGQLYLQLAEMQTIQAYFNELGRSPTDVELETIAQTWSEHCSHKTLAGRIAYRDGQREVRFENMLKETIFAATNELRRQWGDSDWCVSVFKDNAGIVRFDEHDNLCFKVETHNHPSALEPYGGANTGMGGVLRDTMGTGLGAKPICSTDVFCFAPPETPADSLPAGVLHPRRVMHGVVEGVRDYGNRMGIPTVNGAVCFDPRYLGNPLVFCGNVGLIPHAMSFKQPQPGDLIVAMGGRTGRDGIHGATFSSAELTSESESLSGGAVQIGNAIEQKKVLDALLTARDRGLFTAVTDCGAGGFSSAVGEMGEEIGAEVWLDKAPLKYQGLSYTEIWISEAQERMVLSVPEQHWAELQQVCADECVEATILGRFEPTGRLRLLYHGNQVADLPMDLLHNGRPPVVREAVYTPPTPAPLVAPARDDYTADLLAILGSLNVASKEWIIRQYDHEVQGGSVVKPLVGVGQRGPGDAAVVRPKLDSRRGLVVGCGINPRYGDLDPGAMAASAIDEAVRNCVAVGADPARIAVLDNFCWGDCEKPETLGALVRAAIACHDTALGLQTPFISGKDSLNNEFSHLDADGQRQTIAIPPTLLVSAMGQVDDVASCVTMDLKQAGSALYLVGHTLDELGGSHFALVGGLTGGVAPGLNAERARGLYTALHGAIGQGLVRACHDLSEGGLAVAAAEMAFAGGLGATLDIDAMGESASLAAPVRMFSESNARLLCEVNTADTDRFEAALAGFACTRIGEVTQPDELVIRSGDQVLVRSGIERLREAWAAPLRW
ncbi:Phosphoribosylformylglycinamidine synthase subunit PurL [Pirellulimonas nuda]|uniref:Phosphoribosylformylglycinamidine synthase subunit PurL n=1 Tax=Pirellulimonas nuda TaxID=2528009 RepID=A0A518DBC1_9BACT|nr:phosphoribosylformylglycinamidine synthase subunit PurL [Pirellulimonas nuda]QDU88785.1 Phosphoribosylformylglycinamidine synthase subunit PurL [Pirellulimonas nuda]